MRLVLIIVFALAVPAGAVAQVQPPLRLEQPLLDVPANFASGYRAPSMQQSLALSRSFYQAGHFGVRRALGQGRTGRLGLVLFDVLALTLPAGEAWLHEEFHRAVMSRRGIDSFNDVYNFDLLAETIAVSHVEDDDLVRLKRDHPREFVRLMSAGLEGDYALVTALERERFFYDAFSPGIALVLSVANSIAYVASQGAEIDELTNEMNAEDGADIEKRDFTGHDFAAWVYDLHRPDEPYHARGVHPSGVGLDRYIKWSDLTGEEKDFLRLQRTLAFLNLLDPALIGVRGFDLGGARVNFAMRHLLTSFGYTVAVNLFYQRGDRMHFATLHSHFNGERYFPGVSLERIDQRLRLRGRDLHLSTRVDAWLQPKDQSFRTRSSRPGVLVAARLEPAAAGVQGFAAVEAKTAGWVAGNVDLGSAVAARVGFRYRK